jgi:2-polyprenyl-6-methoxyphenol hydroxylase-like FAD-dependent oxidoreductase
VTIVICGAGIAGLTLAWCLERLGLQAWVVERAPHLRDEGYMIDFFGSGYDAAERLDLLPALASIHYPIDRFVFVNAAGRERFSVAYHPLRTRLFAGRHFNFLRGDLERVIYGRFQRREAIRFGTTIDSIEQVGDVVSVTLTDGTKIDADLLVGADGVHSHVRQLAFGDEGEFSRPLGYEMIAFIVENPPALARLDCFVTMTEPNRQVSLYPIRGGRMAAFFLHPVNSAASRGTAHARDLRALGIYGDLNWVVPDLLDRCRTAPSVLFDAVEQIRMARWSRGRVALIGDACWCVSPLAGQGASMAVAGAYVLAHELHSAPTIDAALVGYERRLRGAITRQQSAARRIAKWLVPDTRFRLVARDLVTRASSWPVVAQILRRRMAAQSIFAGG